MIRFFNKLAWCEARHLWLANPVNHQLVYLGGQMMGWETIPTRGLISVDVTDAEQSTRIWTTKIQATLRCPLPIWTEPIAFCLTDIAGNEYLVGLADGPFPSYTTHDVYPDRPSDKSAVTLSIQWQHPYGLMKII